MITELSQVLEQIKDERLKHELAHRLHVRPFGGWRGLFDPYCTEWNNTDVHEKLGFLRELMAASGCRLQAMVDLYQKTYREKGRPHIAHDAKDGIVELLECAIMRPSGKKEKAPRR